MDKIISLAECRRVLRLMHPTILEAVEDITAKLLPGREVYLTGGSVVGRIITHVFGSEFPSPDLDCMVVGTRTDEELGACLQPFGPRRNRYGGYKIIHQASQLKVDLWPMEKHNWWRQPRPTSVAATLRLCTLNVNAIAWCPRRDDLIDRGCRNALAHTILELFHEPDDLGKTIGVLGTVHVLLSLCKYQKILTPGPKLAAFLLRASRASSRPHIERLLHIKLEEKNLSEEIRLDYRQTVRQWFS